MGKTIRIVRRGQPPHRAAQDEEGKKDTLFIFMHSCSFMLHLLHKRKCVKVLCEPEKHKSPARSACKHQTGLSPVC